YGGDERVRLRDKVAVVTGSTSGIGAASAELMAAEGARVVVTGRSEERGARVRDSIVARGGEAIFGPADLGDRAEAQGGIAAAIETFGTVTTLVNNAFASDRIDQIRAGLEHVTTITGDHLETVMRVGLNGALYMCKYAFPEMQRNGEGSIVNVSSGVGVLG